MAEGLDDVDQLVAGLRGENDFSVVEDEAMWILAILYSRGSV